MNEFNPMTEKEKLDSFAKWLVCKNPKIASVIEMMKILDQYIQYKLTVIKHLEDSKNAMDVDFAYLMTKNFELNDENKD